MTYRNIEKFKEGLRHTDWSDVLGSDNGPRAFSLFYEKYCELYNTFFPLQIVKLSYNNRKPWLSEGLKKSIRIKNKLYINQLRRPSEVNIQKYKTYKRQLNRLLKLGERSHYDDLLQENQKNTRKLWSILKDVINKKKRVSTPTQFVIGDKIETDTKFIANRFNQYFTNIGNDLASKIPSVDRNPLSYIPNLIQDSIFIQNVQSSEVERCIKSLKNASAGLDGIHSKVVKNSYTLYLSPLVHVVNLSITQGFFPDSMKVAKVIPLYKSGDVMSISNYRPVSILPLFSKILERLMYNRLLSFINRHNILYKYQFGFRGYHSTNMALIVLIDKIASAIDKGEQVLGVFLDFRKAFDTVNHHILLNKLYKYGIRGTAHQWLTDYLNNRKQYVSFSNAESQKLIIKCGVPQGSILGPLLFLIYINDLIYVSNSLMPILFADDTNIFLSGKSLSDMYNVMNAELSNIVEWLNANRLSLNVDKTHYTVFKSKRRIIETSNTLCINGTMIGQVDHTKFLGVNIDSKLTWDKHISMVKSKVARGIGIICKARHLLGIKSLVTLYYSLIYSHFTYCIEVWGSASAIYINTLFKLQKKIIRIMKFASYKVSSKPLFNELKLLTLPQIYLNSYFLTSLMSFFFAK
jgi:hypothetical protein